MIAGQRHHVLSISLCTASILHIAQRGDVGQAAPAAPHAPLLHPWRCVSTGNRWACLSCETAGWLERGGRAAPPAPTTPHEASDHPWVKGAAQELRCQSSVHLLGRRATDHCRHNVEEYQEVKDVVQLVDGQLRQAAQQEHRVVAIRHLHIGKGGGASGTQRRFVDSGQCRLRRTRCGMARSPPVRHGCMLPKELRCTWHSPDMEMGDPVTLWPAAPAPLSSCSKSSESLHVACRVTHA